MTNTGERAKEFDILWMQSKRRAESHGRLSLEELKLLSSQLRCMAASTAALSRENHHRLTGRVIGVSPAERAPLRG